MTGRIVSAISNLLRVAADDKHSSFLGVLYGKFLIISAIVFCLLWPVFGAMPALNAAWGFSFLVLVFYEWLFSRVVARDQAHSQRWKVRAGCAVFLLVWIPLPPLLSLQALVDPQHRAEHYSVLWLGVFYLFTPLTLRRTILAIRLIREPVVVEP